MVQRHYRLFLVGLVLCSVPALAFSGPNSSTKNSAPKKHSHTTSKSSTSRTSHKLKLAHAVRHHEMAPIEMPAERATQIQTALIQQGYLSGTPTGTWDAPTISAMQKLQGDNGWQTKVTPDSRALIKLGLGPHPPAETADSTQDVAQTTSH